MIYPDYDEEPDAPEASAVDRHSNLVHAIEMVARTPEGVYLLSHIIVESQIFTAGGTVDAEMYASGRRSVAISLLNEIKTCPSGKDIMSRVMQGSVEAFYSDQ